MWVDRFKQLVFDLLAGCGHPEVTGVDWWVSEDGHRNVVVHTGELSFYLWQTRASPPGGDDFGRPEVIVTKRVDAPS